MQNLRLFLTTILPLLSKLPNGALAKLIAALPKLLDVALPFPRDGEVAGYLQRIGIVSPLSDIIEPVWETILSLIPDKTAAANELHEHLRASSPTVTARAVVHEAMEHCQLTLPPGTLELLITVVTDLLSKWWKKRQTTNDVVPPADADVLPNR